MASQLDQCQFDAECVIASATFQRCGTYCDFAVKDDNLVRFDELASSIGAAECASEVGSGFCRPAGRCSPSASVACVDGHCRPLGSCDPTQSAPGDCDDANICTDDRCDPARGCMHVPNSGDCMANEACSVGGVCGDGSCTPSLVRGFARIYPVPRGAGSAITARRDGTILAGVMMASPEPGRVTTKLIELDGRGEILRENVLADPDMVSDLLALDDGIIVAGADFGNGDRTVLSISRVNDDGTRVWGHTVPADKYAQIPRLARSGEQIAVAWHDGDRYNTGTARLALTDLDGAPLKLTDLGPSSAYYHNIAADTFVRVATGVGPAAFVTAHSRPRGGSQMFDNEVVVSHVAADGAIIGSFAFDGGEVLFARGLLVLPSGDVVVWGIDTGERFVQRMTEAGALVWRAAIGIEEMILDGDGMVALGTDGYEDFTADEPPGPAWLMRLDFNAAVVTRLPMARGPLLLDAAPLDDGFVGIADVDVYARSTENAQIWVRRANFALLETECR